MAQNCIKINVTLMAHNVRNYNIFYAFFFILEVLPTNVSESGNHLDVSFIDHIFQSRKNVTIILMHLSICLVL
jgi:hypothetical protein